MNLAKSSTLIKVAVLVNSLPFAPDIIVMSQMEIPMNSVLKIVVVSLLASISFASVAQEKNTTAIDPAPFADASHHWYDLYEKTNVIFPSPGHPKYKNTQLKEVGDNILLYQKNNGGWPKNYDIFAILTPAQKDSVTKAKSELNTTFDNGTSYNHVAALAQIFGATGDERYKDAALKGIDFILSAQYPCGGWPQYYPLEDNYSRHITYNDGAMIGIMQVLKDIIDGKKEYSFVDEKRLASIRKAYQKGLDCTLKLQINDAGKPTAWCQQYDEVSLQPAWARKFEPPSICTGEGAEITLFLMSIDQPTEKVIDAVQYAVEWFDKSKILNTRVKTVSAPPLQTPYRVSTTDRIVVNDPSAPPIWTRYYQFKTHRPIFCNRDSSIVYSLADVARERRDGYGWYTYGPQKVLDLYPAWQKKYAPGNNLLTRDRKHTSRWQ
jgi:PelA/Pel-15E family pectate lyase